MPEVLSFTLPARDFGHLAEKLDVLECHWSGIPEEKLRWYACWHVFDPCTLKCVHCGCCRKWDLQKNPSAAERANAALLLRLRAFFRAIDGPSCPYNFNEVDEPDDDASVPIRVILAPVAKLELSPEEWADGMIASKKLTYPAKKEPRQLTETQLFGPMSEPAAQALGATFATNPDALLGDLESGCICIQERRRAKSVIELARLAGKVHPLCPVCNKPPKKLLADRELADRLLADMRDKFEGEVLVPLEAEAAARADRILARTIEAATARKQAGYAMTCPAVELTAGADIPTDSNAHYSEAQQAKQPELATRNSDTEELSEAHYSDARATGNEPELPALPPYLCPPLKFFYCPEDTGDEGCEGCTGYGMECNSVWTDANGLMVSGNLFRENPRGGGTVAALADRELHAAKLAYAQQLVQSAGYGPLDTKILEEWADAFAKIPQSDRVAINNLILRIDAQERDKRAAAFYAELPDPKPVFWPTPATAVEPAPLFEVEEGFA